MRGQRREQESIKQTNRATRSSARFDKRWSTSVLTGLFLSCLLAPVNVDGGTLGAKFDYYDTTAEALDKPSDTRTDTRQILQIQTYNLNLDRSLYPLLKLNLGGVFKHDRDNTSQGIFERLRKQDTLAPRIGLTAGDRPLAVGIDYNGLRRRQSLKASPTSEESRDSFALFSNWHPNQASEFNLRLTDQRFYNEPKTVDRKDQGVTLRGLYRQNPFSLEYNFNLSNMNNRMVDSDTERISHELRADYRRNYPERNLDLYAAYRGSTTNTDFSSLRATELQLPVIAGLDSLDDSPENGDLTPNFQLIDGNKTVSAGPNIGKTGNPVFLVNLGVDFGSDTVVSQLYVYVDRGDLPNLVTESYIWSVYTSEDNTPVSVWQPHTVIAPALFNSVENRFELDFPAINARYIKVAVSPLSIAIPGPYDDIFVTELEAWGAVTAGSSFDYRTIFQSGNLTLNKRFSNRTALNYDLRLNYNESTLNGAEDWRLANNANLNHRFTPIYSGSLHAGVTKTWKSVLTDQTTLEYSATGRADYLETLDLNLSFSGVKSYYDNGRDGGRDSLTFRTRAELYRGADLDFTAGYSLIEELDNRLTDNFLLGFGAHLVPHPKFDFRVNTRRVRTHVIREGTAPGAGTTNSHYIDSNLTFLPLPRLALTGRYTYRNTEGKSNSLGQFTINWTALSDGDLKFFLTYYESYRTELDRVEKAFTPGLFWRISSHLNLQLRYNWITTDSEMTARDIDTFNGTFNMTF